MNSLAQHLFDTEAVKVCQENKPFWYTSGKIGPYFINTHYLYGSKYTAEALLKTIDDLKKEPIIGSEIIFNHTLLNYYNSFRYAEVINKASRYIEKKLVLILLNIFQGEKEGIGSSHI